MHVCLSIASKAWQDKVLFFSRLDVDDICYKALNAVEINRWWFMACHINLVLALNDMASKPRNVADSLRLCFFIERIYVGFRWLEISYNAERLEAMNLGTDEFRKNIYLLSLDAFAVYLAFCDAVEQKLSFFFVFSLSF